ncbi:MAG: hypothetical protein ACM3O7_10300 [Acidobacteriota bacterium]
MVKDLMNVAGKAVEPFKRRAYGRTFVCPVCHLELAFADVNGDGLVVCPLCGAVIHLEAPYGHPVPVVLDMEIHRVQPKLRLHPLASHLPIGLFPLALAGALVLFLASLVGRPAGRLLVAVVGPSGPAVLERTILLLLVLAVGLSPLTIGAGLWDWFHRYGRRPYRIIRLKIVASIAFVVLGTTAIILQASGAVFSPITGLVDGSSPLHVVLAAAYLGALALGMVAVATLGHIGGNLVFGK